MDFFGIIFLFVIALGVWGLYKVHRDAMNQHILAMEAIHEKLSGIEQALQTLASDSKGQTSSSEPLIDSN